MLESTPVVTVVTNISYGWRRGRLCNICVYLSGWLNSSRVFSGVEDSLKLQPSPYLFPPNIECDCREEEVQHKWKIEKNVFEQKYKIVPCFIKSGSLFWPMALEIIDKRPNSWFYPNLRKNCFIWIEKYLFHPNWRKYWFYLNWRKNGWDWCCLSTFAWNVVARNLSCQFLKMFSLEKEKMRRRMVMVNNQMIFIIW